MLSLSMLGTIARLIGAGQLLGGQSPDFGEVCGLIRSNLAGVTPSELNDAALEGVLNRLGGRVLLGDDTLGKVSAKSGDIPSVSRTNVFEGRFGYLRLASIQPETSRAFETALDALRASNRLEGLVIDLRFVSGTDYDEACRLADAFLAQERILLRWAGQTGSSTAKTNAFDRPLAVLVNSKTAGAAEALAGMLREFGAGMLIGSQTAGMANVFKEFTLSNGQKLLLAASQVELGSGEPMPSGGLAPDIAVNLAPDDEELFLADPYRSVAPEKPLTFQPTGAAAQPTNRPARVTEADLVRMRREGLPWYADDALARSQTPGEPLVTDPALVRALDLLKGLAVVQQDGAGSRLRLR